VPSGVQLLLLNMSGFISGCYGHVIEGPYQKPVGIFRVLVSDFILVRWFA
jgi:hypothetical protein